MRFKELRNKKLSAPLPYIVICVYRELSFRPQITLTHMSPRLGVMESWPCSPANRKRRGLSTETGVPIGRSPPWPPIAATPNH